VNTFKKPILLMVFIIASLSVGLSAQIANQTPAPFQSPILSPGQINQSYVGKVIILQGMISNFRPSTDNNTPNTIFLQDATGSVMQAIYWNAPSKLLKSGKVPQSGQVLRLSGELTQNGGFLQLKIINAMEISDETLDNPNKPREVAISGLDMSMKGKRVVVIGNVANIRPSWKDRAPDIVTLTDGIKSVRVVYWEDLKNRIPKENLPEKGKNLRIEGWLDEYRGELQLTLDNPYNITLLDANGSVSPGSSVPSATAQFRPVSAPPSVNTRNPGVPAGPGEMPAVGNNSSPGVAPGFYPIEKAGALIKGPPPRPHVILFLGDIEPNGPDGRILPANEQLLSITSEAVFVWVNIKKSNSIANQLNVQNVPTWIFYSSDGVERARVSRALSSDEIKQYLQNIR